MFGAVRSSFNLTFVLLANSGDHMIEVSRESSQKSLKLCRPYTDCCGLVEQQIGKKGIASCIATKNGIQSDATTDRKSSLSKKLHWHWSGLASWHGKRIQAVIESNNKGSAEPNEIDGVKRSRISDSRNSGKSCLFKLATASIEAVLERNPA